MYCKQSEIVKLIFIKTHTFMTFGIVLYAELTLKQIQKCFGAQVSFTIYIKLIRAYQFYNFYNDPCHRIMVLFILGVTVLPVSKKEAQRCKNGC